MSEITDKDLASIYSSLPSCSPLVRGLAERLRRVEGERDIQSRWLDAYKMGYQVNVEDKDRFAARAYRTEDAYQELATENTALRERVKELTQCDPCWYDASPADAFMLLKKAQERMKRLEEALQRIAGYDFSAFAGIKGPVGIAQAALKEGGE